MLRRFRNKTVKTELRISLYGRRGEAAKIIKDFKDFFKKHNCLKVNVFLINFLEARVIDLKSDNDDLDYITVKCSDKKVLLSLKKKLAKDDNFKNHLIDYQQPVSFETSGEI